jgi:hypothetical protein
LSNERAVHYIEVPTVFFDDLAITTPAVFATEEEFIDDTYSEDEKKVQFATLLQVASEVLTDRRMQIFLMRYVLRMTTQEIATCLKCSAYEKAKFKKFKNPKEFERLMKEYSEGKRYTVTQPYVSIVLRELTVQLKKAMTKHKLKTQIPEQLDDTLQTEVL